MIVTADVLAFTAAGLKTNFNEAYIQAQQTAMWQFVAGEIPTTLPIQNYAFLGRGATMQAFKDRAPQQPIAEQTYSLADILYKGEMPIERTTLEDDQYGALMMRVRELGNEPVRHWNQLAYQALPLGFTSLCHDGQYYFDTDHQMGSSGVQSNKGTAALSSASLQVAEAAMMGFLDDKGVPMEIVPDTLVVGPALYETAWELTHSGVAVVKSDTTAGRPGTNYANYWQGKFQVVVSPYINGANANNWFLLDTKRFIKPIVMQSRSDVPITMETDMEEMTAKIKEEYTFSARGRYVQGYGLWQLAYGAQV